MTREGSVSIRDIEAGGATGAGLAAEPSPITCRVLGPNGVLPDKYADDTLWKVAKPDPQWIWVLERDGQMVGFLATAPTYPMITMLRLRIDELVHRHEGFRSARS